jgi:hypothetical protein
VVSVKSLSRSLVRKTKGFRLDDSIELKAIEVGVANVKLSSSSGCVGDRACIESG